MNPTKAPDAFAPEAPADVTAPTRHPDLTGQNTPAGYLSGYGDACQAYADSGWSHVLPIPAGEKFPPPGGFTGYEAKKPTTKDYRQWVQERPRHNTALYLPDGLFGIDVDHYGDKRGGDTLAELEERLGALPPTYVSTSRRPDDPVSGIRLYRVPKGLRWSWPDSKLGGIDLCHYGHRYVMAAPSQVGGRRYRWYQPDGTLDTFAETGLMPDPRKLAELPDAWVAYLTNGEAAGAPEVRGALVPVDTFLTDGEPCRVVRRDLDTFTAQVAAGGSRHDAAVPRALNLLRNGERGHHGVAVAYEELRAAFLDSLGDSRGPGVAEREWQRAVDTAVVKITGTPTPEHRKGCCRPDGEATNLPAVFWESRESLRQIRAAAHAEHCSADAVLIGGLVRLSAMVSHKLKMDTGQGLASLNLLGAVIGSSGAGKSTSAGVAARLLPRPGYLFDPAAWADPTREPFHDGLPIGSGEGLAEAFMGERLVTNEVDDPKDPTKKKVVAKKVRKQVRNNAYVYVDEGQTLTKLGNRDSSTIAPTLRSAWSGQTLGQANATVERTRVVPGDSYSLGVLLGYQLGTAGALLGDAEGGTPQRVVFVSAVDPTIPDQRVTERPEPFDTEAMLCEPTPDPFAPADGRKARTGVIDFPDSVKDELWQARLRASKHGEECDPLDSHAGLVRCKLAALLALLDCRGEVTEDDWQLARTVWDVSRAMRARVIEYGREEARKVAEARDDAAVTRAERIAVASGQVGSKVERIAERLALTIHKKGAAATRRDATKLLNSRDRGLFPEALEHAVAQGWLTVDEDGRKVAPHGPRLVES